MIKKIFFGNTNTLTEATRDIYLNERLVLSTLAIVIIVLGVYPQPLLDIGNSFVEGFSRLVNVANVIVK
jgi:NADH-quinone oxidoreductase subunit M